MKCANCSKDGFYIYQIAAGTQLLYCDLHLPSFLTKAKKAGLLKTTESFKRVVEEGLQTLSEKSEELKTETVEPEPVVEEPVVEKPKKKAAKKKAE